MGYELLFHLLLFYLAMIRNCTLQHQHGSTLVLKWDPGTSGLNTSSIKTENDNDESHCCPRPASATRTAVDRANNIALRCCFRIFTFIQTRITCSCDDP